MRVLWAPWRKPYLEKGQQTDHCILCQKSKEREDRKNLILRRGHHCFILLNLFPYNNGHLMIAPYRHLDSLTSLSTAEVLEMVGLAQESEKVLRATLSPEGFNLGMNLGKIAGA